MDDDLLLALLCTTIEETDPVPAEVVDAARAVFWLQTVGAHQLPLH